MSRSGWKRRAGRGKGRFCNPHRKLQGKRKFFPTKNNQQLGLPKLGVWHQVLFHFFLFLGHARGEEFFRFGQFGLTFFFASHADEQLATDGADIVILRGIFFAGVEVRQSFFFIPLAEQNPRDFKMRLRLPRIARETGAELLESLLFLSSFEIQARQLFVAVRQVGFDGNVLAKLSGGRFMIAQVLVSQSQIEIQKRKIVVGSFRPFEFGQRFFVVAAAEQGLAHEQMKLRRIAADFNQPLCCLLVEIFVSGVESRNS